MRDFHCPNCGQRLTFENSTCLNCGSALGFSLDQMALLVIAEGDASDHAGFVDAADYQLCANLQLAECNWLVPVNYPRLLCASCALTTERPNDSDTVGLAEFAEAEAAKRRLIVELHELKLPIIGRDQDPDLRAGLPAAVQRAREGDDRTRKRRHHIGFGRGRRRPPRAAAGRDGRAVPDPARDISGTRSATTTSIGWSAPSNDYLARFNELFGDPDADYQEALDRHYSEGAPEGWQERFVSSYATMHPAEDWAETFAHYLHIRDTLDTSAWCGLAPASATFDRPALGPSAFPTIIEMWLPLSWSLNMVNRSMGHDDLYPFVLPAAVLEKMQFIHTVIDEVVSAAQGPAAIAG